jgi:hypothetical protein
MAEIILKSDPKVPAVQRILGAAAQRELLEHLVPSFARLINSSGPAALEDAIANVPLKEIRFRTS